eukprot:15127813-Ditylum_brightwellii.AAC.1
MGDGKDNDSRLVFLQKWSVFYRILLKVLRLRINYKEDVNFITQNIHYTTGKETSQSNKNTTSFLDAMAKLMEEQVNSKGSPVNIEALKTVDDDDTLLYFFHVN